MAKNESPNGPNAITDEAGTPEGVHFTNSNGVLTVTLDSFDVDTLKNAAKAILSR